MTGTVARCRFDYYEDCNDCHGWYCSKEGGDDNEKHCAVVGAAALFVVVGAGWSEGKFGP